MHAASFYGRAVHRDERYDDERGRDHPHPHHVGQIARCDVVASERVRACDQSRVIARDVRRIGQVKNPKAPAVKREAEEDRR